MKSPDIVTVEIIGNRLKTIAELMGDVLVRSSFSANIKERRDCSTAIFDSRGKLVVQAEHIPLHLGSMLGTVKTICGMYSGSMEEGDVFISNDPYYGGTHLPDINIITPFFRGKRLVNLAANIAHHSDIGGARPGGIAGDAESIYEEGLRIKPVRLKRKGRIDDDLLQLITGNCRMPEERMLDLKAQVAANEVGMGHLKALYEKYDDRVVIEAMGRLLDYSERKTRSRISGIKPGRYCFQDCLDDDGISTEKIPIKTCIEVKGDSLKVDFTGSGKQCRGAINVVHSALLATVYYALKAFMGADIPVNAGLERVLEVSAPEKSVLNPDEPAAVGARTDTCQRVAGTMIGALNRAVPEMAVAGSNDASTAVVFSREDDFVYVEAVGGGSGAFGKGDGLDGVQVHITNTSNLPIEVLESEFPLRVEKYGFVTGSGGKGRYTGGMGLIRKIKVLEDGIIFSSHGDRHKVPPWGWDGGKSGSCGSFILNDSETLPSKNSGLRLDRGDTITIITPGGGGFGGSALSGQLYSKFG